MNKDIKIYEIATFLYEQFANPMGIDFSDLDCQSETKNSYFDIATEIWETIVEGKK